VHRQNRTGKIAPPKQAYEQQPDLFSNTFQAVFISRYFKFFLTETGKKDRIHAVE